MRRQKKFKKTLVLSNQLIQLKIDKQKQMFQRKQKQEKIKAIKAQYKKNKKTDRNYKDDDDDDDDDNYDGDEVNYQNKIQQDEDIDQNNNDNEANKYQNVICQSLTRQGLIVHTNINSNRQQPEKVSKIHAFGLRNMFSDKFKLSFKELKRFTIKNILESQEVQEQQQQQQQQQVQQDDDENNLTLQ